MKTSTQTPKTEIKILVAAMHELANTVQSDDGIANAAISEAAQRLEEQNLQIIALAKSRWISTKISLPPLLEDHDYSENVWGWDGKNILVVCLFFDGNGWLWGNAYGDVFGDPEIDDDYDIKYWQPIAIPVAPDFSVSGDNA